MILRREGSIINHKKVFRIYQNLGLKVRKRVQEKELSEFKVRARSNCINQRWPLDFVSDSIDSGR
jgi:putative transposase